MDKSTVDAEYISLASVAEHMQVLKTICVDSGLLVDEACYLKTGNQAVCALLAKPNGTKLLNFIDITHQLLQHPIFSQVIKIVHYRACLQKGGIFTTPL